MDFAATGVLDSRAHGHLAPELPAPVHPLGEIDRDVSRLCEFDLCTSPHERGVGIGASPLGLLHLSIRYNLPLAEFAIPLLEVGS